jgi:hypothetical protein
MYAVENYARCIGFSKEFRSFVDVKTVGPTDAYLYIVRLEAESVLRDMKVPVGADVDILEYRDTQMEVKHREDKPDDVVVKARFNSLIDCYNGYRADRAMARARNYIDENEWGKASAALDTAMNYSNGFVMPSSPPTRVTTGDDFVDSLGNKEIAIDSDIPKMIRIIEALSTKRHSAKMRAALLRAIELIMSKVYTDSDSAIHAASVPSTAGAHVSAPSPAQAPAATAAVSAAPTAPAAPAPAPAQASALTPEPLSPAAPAV